MTNRFYQIGQIIFKNQNLGDENGKNKGEAGWPWRPKRAL